MTTNGTRAYRLVPLPGGAGHTLVDMTALRRLEQILEDLEALLTAHYGQK